MKIAIVKNNYKNSIQTVSKLKKLLANKFTFGIKNPDFVISIGGDGTFLRAVKKFWRKDKEVKFFSIHSGTLGFYSDYTCNELLEFIKAFKASDYEIQQTELLEITQNNKVYNVLNDFRIESANKTAIMDVTVNGKHLELFRGNGLNFSTNTGSTAYNKSLGGAILWPSVVGFQMTEVAPISNNAYSSLGSPVIFGINDEVIIKGNFSEAFIGLDAEFMKINGRKTFKIKLSKHKVSIARFTNHYDFHKRLKDGFIK